MQMDEEALQERCFFFEMSTLEFREAWNVYFLNSILERVVNKFGVGGYFHKFGMGA